MANPDRNDDRDLQGLRRANRDEEQHWRDKGWERIEGGKDRNPPPREQEQAAEKERTVIGADYTRSPFDPSLVRDEQGNLRTDRADVLRGYGEPNPERNYPRAYDQNELQNPNLNPMMEVPRSPTATFRILAIVCALVLFGLVAAALYWNFLAPVRHAPEAPNGKVQQSIHNTAAFRQHVTFAKRMNERL